MIGQDGLLVGGVGAGQYLSVLCLCILRPGLSVRFRSG